ncbi:membrane fusion protein (multidrug efflux system) [Breoghania corrubedonensis]|uniref:Membrane fusion protein (Multidrug efflux system) n=1 Tax=Breoghania corrubedonensis TaxID=665038 RepID=A0A2T5VI10_9HYPH|nr:efflux RND transporter periplasmic adaptor subunit [Breoghania corrubedonensis]PTW63384.1 membrane fusion protein (multidrug efflux system) [Breoghania corrubedonensis]
MKRLLLSLFFLVLVCVIAGGLVWFNMFRDKMIGEFFANRGRPTVTVSTAVVKPEDWQPGIEAIGTVLARQGVDVAVRSSGIVKEISFKANDKVEAHGLLVQLDDELEQADLIAARANVTRDTQALERASTLKDRGFNSTSTLDNAKAALDASRSQLEKVKAQIDQKKTYAPFGGTIGIVRIDLGEYVSPGKVIATLQDLERMKVDFSVPEQELERLSIGQPIRIGLADNDLLHQGNIVGIDPKIDPASRLVKVQAEVDNEDNQLRPGQFAFVRIELPMEKGIIALPQTSVVESLYGTYVYAIRKDEKDSGELSADMLAKAEQAARDGKEADGPKLVARQLFVKTGRRFGGNVEIVSGVEPGEVIVTAGQNKLSVGSPVRIDNSIDPSRPFSTNMPGAKSQGE